MPKEKLARLEVAPLLGSGPVWSFGGASVLASRLVSNLASPKLYHYPLLLLALSSPQFSMAAAAAADRDRAWVDQRVRELQPTAEEKRFDVIGWAPDIGAAERLAKELGRPVFLFTMDGRINTGRC